MAGPPGRITSSVSLPGHRHTDSGSSSNFNDPPEHLSEFYSFMNNKSNISISPQQSPNLRDILQSDYKTKRIDRQPSLNTFTSFTPSVLDLPNILTSKDFDVAVDSYQNTLTKAENLRKALLTVSEAANEFGQALEDTVNRNPKVNNTKHVSDGIINAGSLQYIVGSNHQILSRLLQENFQQPLQTGLDELKENYKINHAYYQQEVKIKSKALRLKELENIKLSKLKTRNLTTYKNNLLNLTSQLDEIDRLKYDYYHEVNSLIENFNQNLLLTKTGSVIRAELELFEGIARKGWSGGGLDGLLEISPDLFAIPEEPNKKGSVSGMDSIMEDNESYGSDDKDDANETMETVKLSKNEDNGIREGFDEEEEEVPNGVEDDRDDEDEDQADQSFSLPKVSNSIVSRDETETDYTNEDILDVN